jgi:hypothetical protein
MHVCIYNDFGRDFFFGKVRPVVVVSGASALRWVRIRTLTAWSKGFEKMRPALWSGELTRYAETLPENTLGGIGTLSSMLVRASRLVEAGSRWSSEALRRGLLTEA